MTLWEFAACVDGYRRANGSDEEQVEAPDAETFRDMVQRLS